MCYSSTWVRLFLQETPVSRGLLSVLVAARFTARFCMLRMSPVSGGPDWNHWPVVGSFRNARSTSSRQVSQDLLCLLVRALGRERSSGHSSDQRIAPAGVHRDGGAKGGAPSFEVASVKQTRIGSKLRSFTRLNLKVPDGMQGHGNKSTRGWCGSHTPTFTHVT